MCFAFNQRDLAVGSTPRLWPSGLVLCVCSSPLVLDAVIHLFFTGLVCSVLRFCFVRFLYRLLLLVALASLSVAIYCAWFVCACDSDLVLSVAFFSLAVIVQLGFGLC